jgi:predicted TIM-barrel enzyme
MTSRDSILRDFATKVAAGEPIFGSGAGIGLSAIAAEQAGLDFLVVYNSGRYRMAGRSSMAGLMPYGDANAIVLDMAREILPVVERIPVFAGVCGTDPFRIMRRFLTQLKDEGYVGVQNFPTVSLFEGMVRTNLEETGLGFDREVEMVAEARDLDLVTCTYVVTPEEGAAMAGAGADIVVPHMGTTITGDRGARTSISMDEAKRRTAEIADAARAVNPDVFVLLHGGPIVGPREVAEVLESVAGLHGFLGASSMERHPTETALADHMRDYRRLRISVGRT